MTPTPAVSAACGDQRHHYCNGNTQDAAGRWVYCQCPTSGCTCAILTRQAATDAR